MHTGYFWKKNNCFLQPRTATIKLFFQNTQSGPESLSKYCTLYLLAHFPIKKCKTITTATRAQGEGCAPFRGEKGPHLTQCGLGRGYLCTKWRLDPSAIWPQQTWAEKWGLLSSLSEMILLALLLSDVMTSLTTTTILWPFFRDQPGEPVPEENFWTLWCKGRLTKADTDHPAERHSIRTNQCPPPLSPIFLHAGCPSCRPTNSAKALKD